MLLQVVGLKYSGGFGWVVTAKQQPLGRNYPEAPSGVFFLLQPLVSGAVGVVVSHRIRLPRIKPTCDQPASFFLSFPVLSCLACPFPFLFFSFPVFGKKHKFFVFIKVISRQAAAAVVYFVNMFLYETICSFLVSC